MSYASPPAATPVDAEPATAPPAVTRVVGLLLVLPAGLLLLVSYVVPTVWTVWISLHETRPVRGTSRWVGADNYTHLWDTGHLSSYGFTASTLVPPVLAVTLGGLLVAYLAHVAGRATRRGVRVALAAPMVALAPTAAALAWILDHGYTLGDGPVAPSQLVRWVLWLTLFGLLVGVSATVYLAALRGRERPGRWPAVLVAAALLVLATAAAGLQTFAYPWVLVRGGLERATTPLLEMYGFAFQQLEFGVAAAAASVLLLVLGGLGLVAVGLAVLTRLRMEVAAPAPERPYPTGARVAAALGAVVAVVVVLAVTGYGLWPWLRRLPDLASAEGWTAADTLRLQARTWLPALVGTSVGMLVAGLAAFGIGALRPLGRFSPVLLLPFAPWVFVGDGPLSLFGFRMLIEFEMLGSFLAMVPPGWVVVPAVVLLTLLFLGQQGRWRWLRATGTPPGAALVRAYLLPGLPMVLLLGLATLLVRAQGLLWGLVSSLDPSRAGGSVWLFVQTTYFGGAADARVGVVYPLPVLLVFAVTLAALQVGYLDRLVLRVGPRQPGPPGAAGTMTG